MHQVANMHIFPHSANQFLGAKRDTVSCVHAGKSWLVGWLS